MTEPLPSLTEAILGASEAAVVVADAKGRIVEFSRGAELLFGYPRAEALGRPAGFLMPKDQADAHARALERIDLPGASRTDRPLERKIGRRADGTVFPIELSLTRIALGQGSGWVTVMREEHEEDARTAERGASLLASQRLELLGELASGVAHDLNNLLTPILASVDLLDGSALETEARIDLRAIAGAAVQGRHLLRQLLYFSRGHDTRTEATAVDQITREALAILERTRPPGMKLKLETVGDLPRAKVDPVQLEQVLLNLTSNAIYATRDQGDCVTVTLDTVTLHGATRDMLGLASEASPGGQLHSFVRLRVQDQGPGVAEEDRERIFEPFFTTKGDGEGTGLGLSVSRGIAQRHGGMLRLEPSARGACFALYLPVADTDGARRPAEPKSTAASNLRRVMAVDDDAVVLRALSRLLGRLGLEVESFTEPALALAYLTAHPGAIDAVLTDHQMPSISGMELAEVVRRLHPELPILLVSGLGERALDSTGRVDAVLPKPFRQQELADALHRAVRAHGLSAAAQTSV